MIEKKRNVFASITYSLFCHMAYCLLFTESPIPRVHGNSGRARVPFLSYDRVPHQRSFQSSWSIIACLV